MDASSSVHTETHQHHPWLVHHEADGIGGAVPRVPAASLAGLGEAVGGGLHRVQGVQPVHLHNNKDVSKEFTFKSSQCSTLKVQLCNFRVNCPFKMKCHLFSQQVVAGQITEGGCFCY